MRKGFYWLMWLVVLVFFLSGVLIAQPRHPAPFQKAKEMALKCPKNENGDHVLSLPFKEQGVDTEIVIIYGTFREELKNHDVVLLIKRQGPNWIALGHCGICDDYRAAGPGTGGLFIEIEKDIAIQAAFDLFRELVKYKLIRA